MNHGVQGASVASRNSSSRSHTWSGLYESVLLEILYSFQNKIISNNLQIEAVHKIFAKHETLQWGLVKLVCWWRHMLQHHAEIIQTNGIIYCHVKVLRTYFKYGFVSRDVLRSLLAKAMIESLLRSTQENRKTNAWTQVRAVMEEHACVRWNFLNAPNSVWEAVALDCPYWRSCSRISCIEMLNAIRKLAPLRK